MKVVSKILNVLSLTFSFAGKGFSSCTDVPRDSLENFGSPGKKKSLFTGNSNNPALWCLKTANERYFCEFILLISG